MGKRIVIIGGGTAGASAAFAVRMKDKDAEITVITDEKYPTYSRCALPFAVSGKVKSLEKCIVFDETKFKAQRISLIKPAKALSLDTEKREIVFESGGERKSLYYDSLVLSTGGRASVASLSGAQLEGNLVLRTYDDAARMINLIKRGARVVVNGASFVALEVAEALKERGADVKLVVRSRVLRAFVDPQISDFLKKHLESHGISVLQGAEVEKIEGDSRIKAVIVGGERIETDFLFHGTGTLANTELAKSAGISIGKTGGIIADKFMRTSVPDVYTCGDCAEIEHYITKRPTLSALGTIAARHGMAAGENAAGGERSAAPVLGATVMHLFGLEIGSVGLTEVQAKDAGFDTVCMQVKYPSLPHYFEGGEEVSVRMVAENKSGRILGAQVVCTKAAAIRVNLLSTAILAGMTVSQFADSDFCYSPPCSDVWAPEAIAAQTLARRLKRT